MVVSGDNDDAARRQGHEITGRLTRSVRESLHKSDDGRPHLCAKRLRVPRQPARDGTAGLPGPHRCRPQTAGCQDKGQPEAYKVWPNGPKIAHVAHVAHTIYDRIRLFCRRAHPMIAICEVTSRIIRPRPIANRYHPHKYVFATCGTAVPIAGLSGMRSVFRWQSARNRRLGCRRAWLVLRDVV